MAFERKAQSVARSRAGENIEFPRKSFCSLSNSSAADCLDKVSSWREGVPSGRCLGNETTKTDPGNSWVQSRNAKSVYYQPPVRFHRKFCRAHALSWPLCWKSGFGAIGWERTCSGGKRQTRRHILERQPYTGRDIRAIRTRHYTCSLPTIRCDWRHYLCR